MRDFPRSAMHCVLLTSCSLFCLCELGAVAEAKEPFLFPNTLVVSTTTYDNTQGAVHTLTPGVTRLAGSAGSPPSCVTATAANDYVHVWSNETPDASFGVTSAITLTDVDPSTGNVLATLPVPTNQVVTSFPSKSEIGLHYTVGPNGPLLTFEGYAGAGVGALDASNSDAFNLDHPTQPQDPTNPVTQCFGALNQTIYAFPRTVVSVYKNGTFAYTPTVAYGGNNGRSVLFSPSSGFYYSVGNANNGSAKTYGNNGTDPDVTQTTGLEVINPLNWPAWNTGTIPANNSLEVDPQYASIAGDKAGKDSNFRGVTEYKGALYFTKGSGSNGIDTVYTVSPLPTLGNATTAVVSVVPGFPTDSAKSTGGNYTPFAVYFANATTMYVTDEGSGSSTDATSHAGLQKWSLVNGTWKLDYVLTKNLIGTSYTLTGSAGPWPTVTTVGLRNLTGVVNGNNVTLWATTSTSSGSGDNGADPNEVVAVTDDLSATTLPQNESFSVLGAPVYGSVYRGVAYIAVPQTTPHG